MLNFKKKNLNIVLGAILFGLMYHTPSFLHNVATNILGRAILLIILSYLSLLCDFSCAVIFALIIIVLFQNTVEGLDVLNIKDPNKANTTEEEVEERKKEEVRKAGEAEVAAMKKKKKTKEPFVENNENKGDSATDTATDSATDATQAGADAATKSTEDALGISFTRPIDSVFSFISATYNNVVGLTRQTAGIVKKPDPVEESFLGMNYVSDLNSVINKARVNLTNMTDLDRRLKTSAETNTIYSSRDIM